MSQHIDGLILDEPQQQDVLRELNSLATTGGFTVEDLRQIRQDGHNILQVIVDALPDAEEGLDLDGIADISREISQIVDRVVQVSSAFMLEVSSPGPERPLTQPHHFRRNIGRLVTFRLAQGRTLTGRIVGWSDSTVEVTPVAIKGKPQPEEHIRLEDIEHAVVEFELASLDRRPDSTTEENE